MFDTTVYACVSFQETCVRMLFYMAILSRTSMPNENIYHGHFIFKTTCVDH